MTRTVDCVVLGEPAEGLERPPLPGELGQRIYDNVSREGWARWLEHQTMLVNEHRLSMRNAEHRRRLASEAEAFFFGKGSQRPDGYRPPAAEADDDGA